MKTLVMGGTGWLGHTIVKRLVSLGYDVTILTRGRKQTFAEEVRGVKTVQGDKSNEADMREVFRTPYTHVIDTVPTSASIDLVVKYASHLRHYIHCSSTGGYAPLPFIPCNETAHYGGFDFGGGWKQKAEVDGKVMGLFTSMGFPATVIRPCYITGIGMLPLDNLGGRRDDFIKDILEGKPLDLPENGKALLQPIHVKDLANSFYLAMTHTRSIGQIYNICLDHALTLNDYLAVNAAALDRKVTINYLSVDDMLEKYKGSINEVGLRFLVCHMCFSIDKARRDLEYAPAYTPEEAIQETAVWAASLL